MPTIAFRFTMQHRAVPDVPVFFDDGVGAREAVHHAAVLDVAAALHDDAAEVAAQARARRHVAARPDDHVTDQRRRRMHEGGRVDDRHDSIDLVAGHSRSRRYTAACQRRCTTRKRLATKALSV
jgi:hypothetical protein